MTQPKSRIKIGDVVKIYTMGGAPQYSGAAFEVSGLEYYGDFQRPADQYCAGTGLPQSPYMVVFRYEDGRTGNKHWEDFCEVKHWEDFCEVVDAPFHEMDDKPYEETMQAIEIMESLGGK